ncbi:MAG: GNAT family N-acetyltransferase [Synechococcus sp. ELA057]
MASLQSSDLSACLALDQRALGGLWNAEQWGCELEDPRRPGTGIRLEESLVAMASGWLVVDELHVTLVAVDPRHRRCGLGRAVLAELLARGRRMGAVRATLEVAAGNSAALHLYAGCGFETAGIRRGYYRSGEDALIQWTHL